LNLNKDVIKLQKQTKTKKSGVKFKSASNLQKSFTITLTPQLNQINEQMILTIHKINLLCNLKLGEYILIPNNGIIKSYVYSGGIILIAGFLFV